VYTKPPRCPYKDCENSKKPTAEFYIKKGYYKTKYNSQQVPRYKCRNCKRCFSSRAFRPDFKQKKPFLNKEIFKLYCSAMTQRRIAKILKISRQTVANKFVELSVLARRTHEKHIKDGKLKTNYVQLDEMFSYEHTKYLPLSIAVAIRAKTGEIIEAQVAQSHSAVAKKKVPIKYRHLWRPNLSHVAVEDCIISIEKCARDPRLLTILSDKTKNYFTTIKTYLPQAVYAQHSGRIPSYIPHANRKQFPNPLFMINHICAKIRADLSRMRRRTWITTKKRDYLQAHLDLYIAWHNGYKIC
jgi:transposase-like protein